MRAAWYSEQGAASEVLNIGEVDVPVPGPGEILVRVAASGINPSDVKQRGGAPGRSLPFPRIVPHHDGSGVIADVGSGVSAARIGQRVMIYRAQYGRPFGTAAEYVAVPEALGVEIPAELSFAEAAAIGVPGITAGHAVSGYRDLAGLNLLITGAGGAVGGFAVALAAHRGANVFALVRSPRKQQRVRDIGAHHIIEDGGPAAERYLAEATGGRGIDVAIDVDFSGLAPFLVTVAAPEAAIVTYGSARNDAMVPIRDVRQKGLSIHGFNVYRLSSDRNSAALAGVMDLLATTAFRPSVDLVLPLDRCAEAHDAVEGGRAGKVVLSLP